MLLIDRYAYINGLKNWPPQFKLIISIIGMILPRIADNHLLHILIICIMFFLVVFMAGMPMKAYIRTLLAPISFIVISIVILMISVNGEDYICNIEFFGICLGITLESMNTGLKLFSAVVASLTSIYFLVLTTPTIDIIRALKFLKLPNLFIELMVLIYRSIFIFVEEANNIYSAQILRFGYEGYGNSIRSIALLIQNLFTRVFIRHDEMILSLECKLYDGEFRLGD